MRDIARRILLTTVVMSFVGLSLGSAVAGFTVVVPRPPRVDEEPSIPALPEGNVGIQGVHGDSIDAEPNNACGEARAWPDGMKGDGVGTLGWTEDGLDEEDWSKIFVIKSELLNVAVTNATATYYDSSCAPVPLEEVVAATDDLHIRLTQLTQGGSDLYEIGFTLIPNDAGLGRDAADYEVGAEIIVFPALIGAADFDAGLRRIGSNADQDWYRYEIRPVAAATRQEAGLFHVRYSEECTTNATPTEIAFYSGDSSDGLGSTTGSCETPVDFFCVYVGSTAILSHVLGGSRGYTLEASTIPLRLINTEIHDWLEFVIDNAVQTGPPEIEVVIAQIISMDLPMETPWCDSLSSRSFEVFNSDAVQDGAETAQFIVNAGYRILE